jgi:glycosyltransferase involved in cell wall biosynthesis
MSVRDIGRIRKPVIWTLHDMWPFCGTEHLASDVPSARWRTGYEVGNRPDGQSGLDLDRLVWRLKRRAWPRPYALVTPSNWLGECAEQSALLAGWPRGVIPNPLDTRLFSPQDRDEARRELQLPRDVPIVLYGAVLARKDPRKGYDLLKASLASLAHRPGAAKPLCVAFGEAGASDGVPGGVTVKWVGRVDDDEKLARLYSAADVMVVPSRLENLAQTATEAQACGCPVAGFAVTGMPDAVAHGETGYLARAFDADDLARGIAWILDDAHGRRRLRVAARERAVRLWSSGSVAERYVSAFAKAIRGTFP